ncbi:hypothetical protein [Sulfurovum sp.]|uniref:hypothetical protein n=1 Tax=Sulfurovum sp. TaxID=1969726 RepID=UPI002609DD51|nr:hypothetical protein [Sulfurovum sp.]
MPVIPLTPISPVGFTGITKTFDPNICVYAIGTDGNNRGYIENTMGAITPNATYSGIPIYQATWDVVTGDWIISFGDGTTYVDNIPNLLITHYLRPDGNTAKWDDTAKAYLFNDLELAQAIGDDDTKSCFWVEQLPELIFSYDYAEIKTGERE